MSRAPLHTADVCTCALNLFMPEFQVGFSHRSWQDFWKLILEKQQSVSNIFLGVPLWIKSFADVLFPVVLQMLKIKRVLPNCQKFKAVENMFGNDW